MTRDGCWTACCTVFPMVLFMLKGEIPKNLLSVLYLHLKFFSYDFRIYALFNHDKIEDLCTCCSFHLKVQSVNHQLLQFQILIFRGEARLDHGIQVLENQQ